MLGMVEPALSESDEEEEEDMATVVAARWRSSSGRLGS
jgi:hypothetical protein